VVPIEERRGGRRPWEDTIDQEREEVLKPLESSGSADYKSNAKGVSKATEGHSSPLDQVSSAIKGDNLTSSSTYPTARNNIEAGRGTAQHQHIGRSVRNDPNSPAPLFDDKSPFPDTEKWKAKRSPSNLSGGDMDDEADDELLHAQSKGKTKPEGSDDNEDDEDDVEIVDTDEYLSSQSQTPGRANERRMKRFRFATSEASIITHCTYTLTIT
jgi:hypothetical protein